MRTMRSQILGGPARWVTILGLVLPSPFALAQGLFDLNPHQNPQDPSEISRPAHWMAIVGDSGTTGAASNLNLEPTAWNLLGHGLSFFWNSRMTTTLPELSDYPHPERFGMASIQPMTRVLYSSREYEKAVKEGKVVDLNAGAKGSLAVDVQEHGNGYMVGRALGIEARDIVLTGQDGVRVTAIPEQFERIFEMKTETLPPLVLVSFTANDFCDEGAMSDDLTARAGRFAKNLALAWEKSRPFLKAHPLGTKIVVLPQLEVANVLANDDVLSQRVNFVGLGTITCRMVRENKEIEGFLAKKLSESLGGMCKSVLRTKPSDTARIERLRALQGAFNEAWRAQVENLNREHAGTGLEWRYLEGLRGLKFSAGDLANDCFHPGVAGHAKIAEFILRELKSR